MESKETQSRGWKGFSRAEKSWIMYDWANSIYATNISAAIWPIYFAMVIKGLSNAGVINTVYGYAVSAANLIAAILSPFLGAIGEEIPLHISRFFPCFHMTDREPTDVSLIYRLAEVARERMKYVYTGNC